MSTLLNANQINGGVVKPFATLSAAVVSTTLQAGDTLNITERTTGGGDGGQWRAVLSSTVTENTTDIVQCTGVPTLSIKSITRDKAYDQNRGITENGVVDIFLIYGQSNALGTAATTPGDPPHKTPAAKVWNGAGLSALTNYMYSANDSASTGGAWVAFANEYVAKTGRRLVIVNAAKGAQSLNELSKGVGTNYSSMVSALSSATATVVAAGDIVGLVSCLFWQGETDFNPLRTAGPVYKTALEQLWTDIKTDTDVTSLNVVTVGNRTIGDAIYSSEIQKAQRQFARENDDVNIVFDHAASVGAQGLKRVDNVHLDQHGYNFVGKECAINFVETVFSPESAVSKPQLERYGRVNLDPMQDWELYGGIITKGGASWTVAPVASLALPNHASGVISATEVGDNLEIVLADKVTAVMQMDAKMIAGNGYEIINPKIVYDIHTNEDGSGRSKATVKFFGDLHARVNLTTGVVDFNNISTSLNGMVTGAFSTGQVILTHPPCKNLPIANVKTITSMLNACCNGGGTSTVVRVRDTGGALTNAELTVVFTGIQIPVEYIQVTSILQINILATNKVFN